MKNSMFKIALPVTLAAASAMAVATNANAMDFKVSGQVDKAISYADNGKQSDYAFVDNNGSNTRFRFTGAQKLENGYTAGFKYEIGLDNYKSDSFDIGKNAGGTTKTDLRHASVYLNGDFGQVSLGKGFGAADYTITMDLSGTDWLGGGIMAADYAGGLTFVSDTAVSNYTVGNSLNYLNALGRQNRLRYDSPSFGGVVFSGSADNGRAYEMAARYKGKIGDNKLIAGLGYANSQRLGSTTSQLDASGTTNRKTTYDFSASMLMPTGLNFTVAYGKRKDHTTNVDAKIAFGQVGYTSGKNHYAVNYTTSKDQAVVGAKGKQLGLAYVHDYGHGIQFYASFHQYKLDNTGSSLNDIKQLFVGSRIKFM